MKVTIAVCVAGALTITAGCAPQFQSNITPIKPPTSYATSYEQDGLQIGFHVLSAVEQVEHFGVEMTEADVMPVRIVVRNDSKDEFYIQAEQIFGKARNGDLYPGYRLDQTVERIRRSEVGKAMARGAAAGIIFGAALGAASGAALGAAVDDPGGGAAIGAAAGGTAGGFSGAGASADATTRAIKRELRKVDWGSRVIYPGQTVHGFLFMKPGVPYVALEVLLYKFNKRQSTRVNMMLK